MRIEVITTPDQFLRLRQNWERVYEADPHAQLFLSWSWLLGWLPKLRDPWVILAARDEREASDEFVAFWPVRIETRVDDAGELFNDIRMAGNHAADYTGIVCTPAAENRAIAAFARHAKEMNWSMLYLDNWRGPPLRLRQFLAHFAKSSFTIERVSRVNKTDQVDNAICPYAPLPATFDDYLAGLSTNTRQKLRRLLRLVDDKAEYRISLATAETVTHDLDILLNFWRTKWQERKGAAIDGLITTNRGMLLRSFELGLLYLPILWQGDRPLVALATLVDHTKRSFLFYITGRDEQFDGPPVGMLLHAHSIKHAITNGIVRYDFLRGNEPYKYSFASKEEKINCVKIHTRSGRNLGGGLDPRTLDDALKLATQFHEDGKLMAAGRAYRKILQADPRHADTLFRMGQLLLMRRSFAEAKQTFTALTRVRSDSAKAWHYLGQSCEALSQLVEAENAYRNVALIAPAFPDIDRKIARTWTGARDVASAHGVANVAVPAPN